MSKDAINEWIIFFKSRKKEYLKTNNDLALILIIDIEYKRLFINVNAGFIVNLLEIF